MAARGLYLGAPMEKPDSRSRRPSTVFVISILPMAFFSTLIRVEGGKKLKLGVA
jgi:hypothetical protein